MTGTWFMTFRCGGQKLGQEAKGETAGAETLAVGLIASPFMSHFTDDETEAQVVIAFLG